MKTLDDIAKEAGVSTSTVSRALAGSSLVSQKTAQLIRDLAEQNGYQVNRFAQNLATQRSRVIGLVVPDVQNPYFPLLIDTIVRQAKHANYVVIPTFSGESQADEAVCLRLLEEMRAEAVILVTGRYGFPALEAARALRKRGTTLVVLGWSEGTDEFDNVYADDLAGTATLTRHLFDLGHRNIVMIAEQVERGAHDRVLGFRQEMESHGLWQDDRMVTDIPDSESLRGCIASLLARPDRPTALLAYHDILAAKIIRQLQDQGVRVPRDIAVVGFDNLELGNYLRPSLTTIDLAVEAHAATALEILFARLKESTKDWVPHSVVLTPQLVIRESCGSNSSHQIAISSDSSLNEPPSH